MEAGRDENAGNRWRRTVLPLDKAHVGRDRGVFFFFREEREPLANTVFLKSFLSKRTRRSEGKLRGEAVARIINVNAPCKWLHPGEKMFHSFLTLLS